MCVKYKTYVRLTVSYFGVICDFGVSLVYVRLCMISNVIMNTYNVNKRFGAFTFNMNEYMYI